MADILKSRASFLVLLALGQGPRHGYEIAATIQDRSRGFFSVSFGNLYPILHKFEKAGLVTSEWQDAGGTKSRKVYSLTPKGAIEVESEISNFEAMVIAFNGMIGRESHV